MINLIKRLFTIKSKNDEIVERCKYAFHIPINACKLIKSNNNERHTKKNVITGNN